MKTLLTLGLGLLALAPAHAQIFGPRAANGALLGGIAGAVIGHNSGSLSHNGWQGAAIGAGVGALIGAAADHNDGRYRNGGSVMRGDYVYRDGYYGGNWNAHSGYGSYGDYNGYNGYSGYGDYGHAYNGYGYGDHGHGYYNGGYATDGLWLGALGGGIIGHNSGGNWHHNGWRGAAWGAGAGWLLGSVVDSNYGYERSRFYDNGYDYSYPVARNLYVPSSAPAQLIAAPQPAPQPAAAPQQVTIINNYYGNASPMAQANTLFGR